MADHDRSLRRIERGLRELKELQQGLLKSCEDFGHEQLQANDE